MAEKGTRADFVKALKPLGAFAVENPCLPGTPDVACLLGWIECKWLRSWPKREATPVKLDHELLPSQKLFIRKWRRAGGSSWVVLRCGREWFLMQGEWASNNLGTATRSELAKGSILYMPNGIDPQKLIRTLEDDAKVKRIA